MKYLLPIVASLFLAVSAAGIWRTSGEAVKLLADADRTVNDLDSHLGSLRTLESRADGVLSEIEDAEGRQSKYWDQTARQTAGTVKALRLLIDRTDHSLNDQTIPAFNSLIKESDAFLLATDDNEGKLAASAQVAMEAWGHAGDVMSDNLRNEHLQSFMLNMDEAAFHLNGTLEHVDNTVGYYDLKLTTPASFAKRAASFLVQMAVGAGQFARAFFW